MPKASDRVSHFETISNENLIKYIKGSPISLVSGKPIKFGSHEHQHQMRAIRKVMLKRKLQDHKAEKCVSFQDECKTDEVRRVPRKSNLKSLVSHVEEAANTSRYAPVKDPMLDTISRASETLPVKTYPPIPTESIITSGNSLKSSESDSIPAHLMHTFLPPQNKSFY